MFLLLNTYTAPLERIDELIPEHRAWVKDHFANGTFLFGGRRLPRTGGFVVAAGDDPDAIAALLADDPLVRHGVVEWHPVHVEAQFTNSETWRALLAEAGAPTEVADHA
ncbi:YciI family protein [Actinomadura flavalba]|uniref:YciI family protein n=1 Tax=Actinomadura flavalba TaxID=1120938 RepID=UPI0003638CE5|nr:YciI family protein [Actinomadura flavalba]